MISLTPTSRSAWEPQDGYRFEVSDVFLGASEADGR